MAHRTRILEESGFSLLEVLITLVVLAVGLVSLAKFQGTAIENGSLAKARSVAAHLAQEKLDDLRNYEVLITTHPTTGAVLGCNVNDKVRYQCIKGDEGGTTGGNENADGTLILPSGNVTFANNATDNVTYNRMWAVTNFYYPETATGKTPNSVATTTVPTIVPDYPDFKRVTVTVTWTDQDNVAQFVVLTSLISASNPLYSGRVLE